MAIAYAGYRVVGQGHHLTTFEAVELAMGRSVVRLSTYFETCRRKRNMLDYDMANVATDTEVDELLEKAEEFRTPQRGGSTVCPRLSRQRRFEHRAPGSGGCSQGLKVASRRYHGA
jgi:hypothetical protein